ncbi:tail fiber domain-containing protein [Aquimarina sp. MMG016]|uniref:tail fiber domain-containing protein n=1 Tax=Aquimarina sp. MMG016 TaxID=2822690 RepID=UPI001B39F004|nr:tail fiber domain-containing protein [Aquimarina sp. MMG016]MBQ4821715.1 tail fiber domain-containing protein [Aquimarina sp. MMG016]
MNQKYLLFLYVCLCAYSVNAQTPPGINYQSIVRNTDGDVMINQNISFQFRILEDAINGTTVYTETHNVTTSDNGLVTLILGQGVSSDDFSAIDWAHHSHFLEVSIDETGGTNYSALGTSQLLSVPYALMTANTESFKDADDDTKIQVEETADEDIIRFDIASEEQLQIRTNTNGDLLLHTTSVNKSTFLGHNAGNVNIGSNNAFIGYKAGEVNTGSHNTFVGSLAGVNSTAGFNTFLGAYAGENNTTGDENTFVGLDAGYSNTMGSENVFLGSEAANKNINGARNVVLGAYAHSGSSAITGDNNVMLGNRSGYNNAGNGNLFLGYHSGYNELSSNKLYIENSDSNSPLVYGEFDNDLLRINGTLDVNNAYQFPLTDGALNQVLATDGAGNISWNTITTPSIIELTDADDDTKIQVEETADEDIIRFDIAGEERFRINGHRLEPVNNSFSTFLGVDAGVNIDNTEFTGNVGVGFQAAYELTTGTDNIAIGRASLYNNKTGNANVGIGYSTLFKTTGSNNVGVGDRALQKNTTGIQNVVIGSSASSKSTTGSNNVIIGYHAGTSATNSIILNNGDRNIFIGNEAGSQETGSNKLYVESSNSTSPLIYGEFDNDMLRVNGDFEVTETVEAENYIMNGNGAYLGSNLYYDSGWKYKNDDYGWVLRHNANGAIQFATAASGIADNTASIDTRLQIENNGNIGIGVTGTSYKLQVGSSGDGTEARANSWNTFSDRRWKTDFKVIQNAIQKIQAINGYYYKWKNKPDTTTQVGVIAQEIEAVLSEVVSTDAQGYKSVDYSKLTALLIEGIKSQQKSIQSQHQRIKNLEIDGQNMKKEVAEIKAMLMVNSDRTNNQ